MSAQHTPGPWSLATVPTSCGVCHKVGPFPGKHPGDPKRHACMYADYPSPGNPGDAELLANARLIAAAPQLAAALQTFVDEYVRMINSGDCGSWDPEEEPKVIAARAALAAAGVTR